MPKSATGKARAAAGSKAAKKPAGSKASAKAPARSALKKAKPTASPRPAAEAPVPSPGAVAPTVLPEPEIFRVLDFEGRPVGPVPEIARDELHRMYETMLLVRLLDERMMILQRQGRIGFYGTCTGQEAPPTGTAAALEPGDWIFQALRENSAMLYRGYDLVPYLSQVFGNSGDPCHGRQMPSHMSDRAVNQVSWGSCIGSQLPQAVGAAWAAKLRGDRTVSVAFMGDGATSEADFHAAMVFAADRKAPCILICQNNHWSISVPTRGQTAARSIAEKALAYGLPFARVDGNDVLAVYAAVSEAAARARAGGGPTFLELLTYRIGAHSSSDDPRVYRDEAEVDVWRGRDPLARFRAFLEGQGDWSEAAEAEARARLGKRIADALEVAEALPPPAPRTLIEDVFAEVPAELEAQYAAAGLEA